MGKKRKAKTLDAWCWYCDREFEDDKVLLQHQKAKHYKCPYCPRRLNTAGGLTVHLNQVHKAEPTTIENALPGRESFSIEIYGMVGVPEADLAEWRARKRGTRGGGPGGVAGDQAANKRPLIEKMVYTQEQLKAQLEAHKALMSGKAPPPGIMPPNFSQPPPGFGGPITVPPPGYGAPPRPGPTEQHASQAPPTNGSAYSQPPPGFPAHPGASSIHANGSSTPSMPFTYPAPSFPTVNAHEEAVKAGAKTRMVYTDTFMSPEEKLASTSKYRFVDAEEQQQQGNASASTSSLPQPHTQPTPDFSVPPPGFARPPSSQQQHPAQSYPAIDAKSHAEPPSSNPYANTAESLAMTNERTAAGDVAGNREAEMQGAEERAKAAFASDRETQREAVGITEATAGDASDASSAPRQGRARAADLF